MKNKGFTLVELMATIVVIAIVFMIVSVSVLGRINEAKENNAINSVKNYVKSVNMFLLKGDNDDNVYEIDGEYIEFDVDNFFEVDQTTQLRKEESKAISVATLNNFGTLSNFKDIDQEKSYVIINQNYVVVKAYMEINGMKIKLEEEKYCILGDDGTTCKKTSDEELEQ